MAARFPNSYLYLYWIATFKVTLPLFLVSPPRHYMPFTPMYNIYMYDYYMYDNYKYDNYMYYVMQTYK